MTGLTDFDDNGYESCGSIGCQEIDMFPAPSGWWWCNRICQNAFKSTDWETTLSRLFY